MIEWTHTGCSYLLLMAYLPPNWMLLIVILCSCLISHLNLTWVMFEDKIFWTLGITCLYKCTSVVNWLQTHARYTACFFHISCCMSKTTQPLALFCLWQCNGQISNPVQDWRTNAMSGVCAIYIHFVLSLMSLWDCEEQSRIFQKIASKTNRCHLDGIYALAFTITETL